MKTNLLERARFWLGVAALSIRERLVGVECSSCGLHSFLPLPPGWRYTTISPVRGGVGWVCPMCSYNDRDQVW